jgi:3-hydroxybutyryl-CoA dehydrogenase
MTDRREQSIPDRLAVVGAGTMGSGIAQTAVQHGMRVLLYDSRPGQAEAARRAIGDRLERWVAAGRLGREDADGALRRLTVVADFAELADADAAIEAVAESLDVKREVFSRLDALLPGATLLATNTSSLSITAIAQATARPDRVVGMHFFNPAPVMRLVEVVRGEETSDEVVERTRQLAAHLGKETVLVQKDTPGFVVNRILMPLFIEAMRVLEEGIASAADIDKAIKLGLNHPMGPLELADFTGLDIDLQVMDYLFNETHDPRFAAPLVLRRLVRAGKLGRKTGRGFYAYDESLVRS